MLAEEHECLETQFKCVTSHKCISMYFYCDGDEDCADGSDEPEQGCSHPDVTCPPGYFKCGNGRCISDNWVSFPSSRRNGAGNSLHLRLKNRIMQLPWNKIWLLKFLCLMLKFPVGKVSVSDHAWKVQSLPCTFCWYYFWVKKLFGRFPSSCICIHVPLLNSQEFFQCDAKPCADWLYVTA